VKGEAKMSERWVPKVGELYYFISPAGGIISETFYNYEAGSRSRFLYGNVFETQAAAEAAAEKVKALLLSLQDNDENLQDNIQDMVTNTCQAMDKGKENVAKATCNFGKLPKLTAEVFDRPDCPVDAKIAVVNRNGSAYWGSFNIARPDFLGGWTGEGSWFYIPGRWDSSDWQNSLIERPVKENKLPDWCKPGAWVWSNNFGFFLITSIKDGAIKGECPGYGEISMDYHFEDLKEAYLRPFDNEEMKSLVGKNLVNKETKDINLVTDYINEVDEDDPSYHYCTVYVGGENMVAEDLLEDFTIDGYPCGQLERKEDCDDNF
jgi:hypothetical protein